MKAAEIRRLYCDAYAARYEDKFLFSELAKGDTEFEVQLIGRLLGGHGPWLDLACGTGYFLSQFPEVERCGLDISPAMLQRARKENPGVSFHEQSFLQPVPEWIAKWKLVSCMWYAYGLVDSLDQIFELIRNMAGWTHPDGAAFLPTADRALIAGVKLPVEVVDSPWAGTVMVTGITWSYIEGPGEAHVNMLAPQIPILVSEFEKYFARIELAEYPLGRRAIIASSKR